MIDIHVHIIPGVDDGSRSIEESVEMLRSAAEQGVTAMIATSHSDAFWYDARNTLTQFATLEEAVKNAGIPIRLALGTELYCSVRYIEENIEFLRCGTYPTMNGTDFVLAEFSTRVSEEDALYCLKKLQDAGYLPILAHAERCDCIDERTAAALHEQGIFIQINVYSVKEENSQTIKDRANMLLRRQLVDFAGSDAHRMDHRAPAYTAGIQHMYSEYDKEYIDRILICNPKKYLFESCRDK